MMLDVLQDACDAYGKEALSIAVLRRVSQPTLVLPRRSFATQIMPRGGFVPTEGRKPVGICDENQPTWPHNPDQLVDELPRIDHVLDDIRRKADIEAGIAQRQLAPISDDSEPQLSPEFRHLFPLRFDEGARSRRSTERLS